MWLNPISSDLLFTKKDAEDPRMGEAVHVAAGFTDIQNFSTSESADFHLYGYPDDEGIRLNGGRLGAKEAPRMIRTSLYKMTPDLDRPQRPSLQDLGDLSLDIPLAERHERGRALARSLAQQNKKFIALGGGHDYGYADACGFLDAHHGNAIVINFDAHLDVRPTEQSFHSGTPFYRLLSEFCGRVDFLEVGLQNQCNSRAHFDWARQKGARLLRMQDLQPNMLAALQKQLPISDKKVFISLDMDAFTSSEAPGCSQSWATGFSIHDFMPTLEWLIQNFDVAGLGIYEVSPPLDFDNHTSKLAALIAHRFIFKNLLKKEGQG